VTTGLSVPTPQTTTRQTTTPHATPRIIAHRGFSSRQPESTLAAYREAIAFALREGIPLGLECDVRFTADGQLVCLHDATLERTSNGRGPVAEWKLADLRRLDFGSWRVADPTPDQQSLVTLEDLLALVSSARVEGADVELVIETKHPQTRGPALELEVCRLLARYGWKGAGAPVRLITFSVPAAELLARLLPDANRTLLLERGLGRFSAGVLPRGIRVAGIDVKLLRRDPGFVARARRHGNEVHAWTVNDPADIVLCRDLGVTGFTSDHPDRVLELLGRPHLQGWNLVPLPRSRSLASSAA
jgi:glycerophosphoryl diester phosphodiesterase